jgi:hypothetical protein
VHPAFKLPNTLTEHLLSCAGSPEEPLIEQHKVDTKNDSQKQAEKIERDAQAAHLIGIERHQTH